MSQRDDERDEGVLVSSNPNSLEAARAEAASLREQLSNRDRALDIQAQDLRGLRIQLAALRAELDERTRERDRHLAESIANFEWADRLRAALEGLLSFISVQDVYSGISPREFVRTEVTGITLGPDSNVKLLAGRAALAGNEGGGE
jgi:hypothetical protein